MGDVNRDGWLDLVTANGDGTVSVFQNNHDGTFAMTAQPYYVGGTPTAVAVGGPAW